MDAIKRKHIRYHADPKTLATVRFSNGNSALGLTMTESQGGCSGVFLKHDDFMPEVLCKLMVGDLPEQEAEIRWVKDDDPEIVKVGFAYSN